MEAALVLIAKYAQYIPLIIAAGGSAAEAFSRLVRLAQGAEQGTIGDDEIAIHRAALDAMIEDFNQPIED
jgi:hypothetical protein